MPSSGRKIVLIDGHSLMYRAYFALPLLTTTRGEPTNAVYGFTMMLLRLIEDEKPDVIAAAFDKGKPDFRYELLPQYKAHRPPMADDLRSQIPMAKQLLTAMGIPIFEVEGYEADDVIGTLATQAASRGDSVLIVTGDKDVLQLVSDHVTALITRRGIKEMDRYGPADVVERLGITASQVVDLKALTGDKSDNVPGVPGIGEKTAARLLARYGDLERLLDQAEEVQGRAGASLRAHRHEALLGKKLVTIRRDVPLSIAWDEWVWRGPDRSRLADLYRRWEFRTLLAALQSDQEGEKEPVALERSVPDLPPVDLLLDEEAITAALGRIKSDEAVAFQWLTDGDPRHDPAIVGVAWVTSDSSAYVPVAHHEGKNVPLAVVCNTIGKFASRFEGPKICHDLKALHSMAKAAGVVVGSGWHDVMLQGYLCAPGQGENTLEALAVRFQCETTPTPIPEDVAALSPARAGTLAAGRCRVMTELHRRLIPKLDEDDLMDLYERVELPLTAVLAAMERRGIRIDTHALRTMSKEMEGQIQSYEEQIFELAGERFNLNSPKQLAAVLFDRLGLPVISKTKTGPSTSAEVLERLAEEHPIAACILEYRQVQKLKSTYVDALPGLVHPETGRIHTSFNQAVAATGRLSSAHPNLQNIPVRTEEGRKIRRLFLPQEGWRLVKADYSQIELRVLAHISEDDGLIEAFRTGVDIHTKTAAEIFGVDEQDVTREQREAAKAVNFGIVYGISSYGLSQGTALSVSEAKAFIDEYFQRYPGVARYMKEVVERARDAGYVTTLLGRRRYVPDIHSRRWAVRNFAERTAINTPIQGSAADIIKAAMIAVVERLRAEKLQAELLLQVHDELLLEVAPEHLPQVVRCLKEEMEGVFSLRVPLVAEVSAGPNWLDQTPVTP